MKAISFSRCLRFVAAALVVAWVGAAKLRASSFDEKYIIPEPGGAAIELKAAKKTYYLGEPFLIEFILKNTGKKQISFGTGGDYRGANREMRYRVQAIDGKGELVPEPTDDFFCGGGVICGPNPLLPGEEWRHELWPLDYMKLTKPGKYTIRITHDFDWNKNVEHWAHQLASSQPKKEWLPKDWRTPIGELQVEFVLPDKKQAEEVIGQISEAIKKSDKKKIPEAKDLAMPEFLAPMRKHVEQGEFFFVEAIGKILTKESTLALIEMTESKDEKMSQAAGIVLGKYISSCPGNRGFTAENQEIEKEPKKRAKPFDEIENRFIQQAIEKEKKLMEAWDDSFAPRVREIARRFIAKIDEKGQVGYKSKVVPWGQMFPALTEVELGVKMLGFLGDVNDYKILRDALSKSLRSYEIEEKDDVDVCHLPPPIPTLVAALDVLHRKGVKLGKISYHDEADLFLAFHWKDMGNLPKPEEWVETLRHSGNKRNLIWRVAVEAVPLPLTEESRQFVIDSLNSQDLGVIYKMNWFILDSKKDLFSAQDKEALLREELLIVRTENNESVFNSAVYVAGICGSKKDLAEALADRLLDGQRFNVGGMNNEALSELCDLVIDKTDRNFGGSSGNTKLPRREWAAIQEAWKKWIESHAKELEEGVKFKLGDGKNLPKELFGRAIYWQKKDGSPWPEQPEK